MTEKIDILFVGKQTNSNTILGVDFFTDINFQDFNAVVILPLGCMSGYSYNYQHLYNYGENALNLRQGDYKLFKNRFFSIAHQLNNYLKHGGTVFIVAQKLPRLLCYDEKGRPEEIDLGNLLNRPIDKTTGHKGEKIEFLNNKNFNEFWKNTKGIWLYQSHYQLQAGEEPLAHATGAPNQVVSSLIKTPEGGKLITIPWIKTHDMNLKPSQIEEKFRDGLLSLYKTLNKTEKINIPEWVKSYEITGEKQLNTDIYDLRSKIIQAEKEKRKKEKKLNELSLYKNLFCGNGNELETAVKKVFEDIGIKLLDSGDGKRVDKVFKFNNFVFATEITGSNHKVKEGHARKVNTWVAETEEKYELDDVKGLLIVNPFKDTPLEDRDMPNAWPQKAIDLCDRHNTCAITGIQLLGIWTEIKNNPDKAEELINKLYETKGVYEGYEDYTKFISVLDKNKEAKKAA